ncbi:hypothetical protein F8M41_025305 [Gigaspora margarita]|uniref:Uncharacterized protein n=1 Tax=Gigaspora margarita TaxID=4874 RepID=A0A8H4A9Y1_GIGMA|nr:hypothetical protein F8M41_025305 [Gigaspora margarita]
MDEPSMTNEYKTFAYWAPGSSKNIDNSNINDEDIDSDISEIRVLKKIAQSNKRQQHGKKSVNSKSWSNENECKKMDIQVEYNSWDPYLERVNLKLFIVLKWINGQKTVHLADDAYSRCPQKNNITHVHLKESV